MYTPQYLALDFETALLDGSPSVEAYRDDFRVTSCAFAWRREDGSLKTKVTWGEEETLKEITKIKSAAIPVIVHNLAFEWMVTKCRFPGFEDIFQFDTMRLAQMRDNGGQKHYDASDSFEADLMGLEGKPQFNGLSLEACVSRFLDGEHYRHKQPYIDLMIERGGSKADFHLLTKEELTAYNEKDAEVTLLLYETLVKSFKDSGIDWSKDHYLYRSRCRLASISKIRGVKVDKAQALRHIETEGSNIDAIERKFRETYKPFIDAVEARKAKAFIDSYSSEKGKESARLRIEQGLIPEIKINFRSSKDKTALFVEEMGLTPKFFTEKGAPSFGAKLLWQFGEAGVMLSKLGTLRISKAQIENLLELIKYDGRWHISIKTTGTKTGRLSGGSNA